MQGSLRYPVMLTVLDGSTVIMKTMILGRRAETDQVKRILLTDSDDEYTVQWSQCENERAPRPVSGGADVKETLKYECGKEEVYSTGQLATKKGDLSTHALTFVPPPKSECWMSDVPETALADAGSPADASAPDMDAGGVDDGGADGGEASSDAGSSDAGAAKADKADAGVDAGAAKKKKPPAQ